MLVLCTFRITLISKELDFGLAYYRDFPMILQIEVGAEADIFWISFLSLDSISFKNEALPSL